MNEIPANVNTGAPCNQPAPLQGDSRFGIIATFRWRTATPLGRPVVPDVYMMSARSPAPTCTWKLEGSPLRASPVDIVTFRDGTASASASAVSAMDAEYTMALASAWVRSASSSDGVSRVLRGTPTAPALCTPAYDSTHRTASSAAT